MASFEELKEMMEKEYMLALYSTAKAATIASSVQTAFSFAPTWSTPQHPAQSSYPSAIEHLLERVPGLTINKVICPVCQESETDLVRIPIELSLIIIHLNDAHLWSREEIADWLDTLDIDLTVQPAKEAAN